MFNHREDYISYDEAGRWINTTFPPDSFKKFPRNSGYRTEAREALFDIFAIQYYDMIIHYRGEEMRLIADRKGCYVENSRQEIISEVFSTANDLILNFRFNNNKTLVDVLDDSEFDIDINC